MSSVYFIPFEIREQAIVPKERTNQEPVVLPPVPITKKVSSSEYSSKPAKIVCTSDLRNLTLPAVPQHLEKTAAVISIKQVIQPSDSNGSAIKHEKIPAPPDNNGKSEAASLQESGIVQRTIAVPAVPRPAEQPLTKIVGSKTLFSARHSKNYYAIQELSEGKKAAPTISERTRLNAQIKELKSSRESALPKLDFRDLQNTLIGKVLISQEIEKQYPQAILVGDDKFIQGIKFDFINSYDGKKTYIRTTALLTEDAKKKLHKFIERKLKKQRYSLDPAKRSRKNRMTKGELRKTLNTHNSYNFEVSGLETVLSLKGRVQILTPLPDGDFKFLGYNEIPKKSTHNFRRYTDSTQLKRWISKTNNDFNRVVADSFQGLGIVLNEILN